MKAHFLIPLVAASIAGCVGLDITPISPADEAAAHAGRADLKGYIVYEPMVVVEVSQKELCSSQDDKGACKGAVTVACSAGTPFLLPDTSKPFLVNVRSGFGKTAVEVAITNGWQLGNIKDNSDNTALLGTLEKILPLLGARSVAREATVGQCKAPGLYRVNLAPTGVTLSPLLIYQNAFAKRDYRDVPFWAEYPDESRIDTPEKRQIVRELFEKLGVDPPDFD